MAAAVRKRWKFNNGNMNQDRGFWSGNLEDNFFRRFFNKFPTTNFLTSYDKAVKAHQKGRIDWNSIDGFFIPNSDQKKPPKKPHGYCEVLELINSHYLPLLTREELKNVLPHAEKIVEHRKSDLARHRRGQKQTQPKHEHVLQLWKSILVTIQNRRAILKVRT